MRKGAAGSRTILVWGLVALSGLILLSLYRDSLDSLLLELPAFGAVGGSAFLALRSRRQSMIVLPVAVAFATGPVLTYSRDLSLAWAPLVGVLLGVNVWAFVTFVRAWTETVRAQKEKD